MEVRILGPVELVNAGGTAAALARQQRTILARLSVDRRQVVPVQTMVRDLWGTDAPARAVNLVHNLIRQLRREIGTSADQVLRTRSPGYQLALDDEIDLRRFEKLTGTARAHLRAGEHEAADSTMARALELWRGEPLGGVTPQLATAYEPTLTELRIGAAEDWFDARLTLGRHIAITPELTRVLADHPRRERLRGQLMLALYRSGRQLEALEVYRAGRRLLVEEAGLEPGPALRRLHQEILTEAGRLEMPAVSGARFW